MTWSLILYFLLNLKIQISSFPITLKKVKSLSHVWLFATPWIVAHQAPPSMGFSRQEYWSGLPFPSPKHLCKVILYTRKLFFSREKMLQVNPPKKTLHKEIRDHKVQNIKFFNLGTGYFCNGYGISSQLPLLNETEHSFCHLSFPVYTPDWWIPTDGFPLQAITPPRGRLKFTICTSSGVTVTYLPYHKTLNCLFLFRA